MVRVVASKLLSVALAGALGRGRDRRFGAAQSHSSALQGRLARDQAFADSGYWDFALLSLYDYAMRRVIVGGITALSEFGWTERALVASAKTLGFNPLRTRVTFFRTMGGIFSQLGGNMGLALVGALTLGLGAQGGASPAPISDAPEALFVAQAWLADLLGDKRWVPQQLPAVALPEAQWAVARAWGATQRRNAPLPPVYLKLDDPSGAPSLAWALLTSPSHRLGAQERHWASWAGGAVGSYRAHVQLWEAFQAGRSFTTLGALYAAGGRTPAPVTTLSAGGIFRGPQAKLGVFPWAPNANEGVEWLEAGRPWSTEGGRTRAQAALAAPRSARAWAIRAAGARHLRSPFALRPTYNVWPRYPTTHEELFFW